MSWRQGTRIVVIAVTVLVIVLAFAIGAWRSHHPTGPVCPSPAVTTPAGRPVCR